MHTTSVVLLAVLLVFHVFVAAPAAAEEYWTDYEDTTGTMPCDCATFGPDCLITTKVANTCSVLRARTQG